MVYKPTYNWATGPGPSVHRGFSVEPPPSNFREESVTILDGPGTLWWTLKQIVFFEFCFGVSQNTIFMWIINDK